MRVRPKTLRARLTLGIALLVFGVCAVVGVTVYYSTAARLTESLKSSLHTAAAQAMAGANYQNSRLTLGPSPDEGGDTGLRGLSLTVVKPDGSVLSEVGPYAKVTFSARALDLARRGESSVEAVRDPASGTHLLVLSTPLLQDSTTVAVYGVALSREPMLSALGQLRLTLLVLLPLAAVVAAFLGYLLVGRMLRPLAQITRTAEEISSRDFSLRRDLPRGEDEVGRLAGAFDAMLERLEESFHRERRFVGDASHELRTPLAALQAIVSVTLSRPRSRAVYQEALTDIDVEAARLRTLAEDLLELARGDVGVVTSQDPVDLSALLESVCLSLRPLAEAKGLNLAYQVPPGLVVAGDEDALVRVFVNVVDNAIKFTTEGEVAVSAAGADGTLHVSVRDTGAGLTAEEAARAFDRFYRGDASRSSGGAGLGLSLARQIVDAHHGSISLTPAAPGAVCRVSLPARPLPDAS